MNVHNLLVKCNPNNEPPFNNRLNIDSQKLINILPLCYYAVMNTLMTLENYIMSVNTRYILPSSILPTCIEWNATQNIVHWKQ